MYLFPVSSWTDPEGDDATTGGEDTSQATGGDAATGGEEEMPLTTGGDAGTPKDLIAWYNSAIKDYDAMFLIYYRGVW